MIQAMNTLLRKQEKKEHFRVYFAAHEDFNLDTYFAHLSSKHALKVIAGSGSSFQTIEIMIKPSLLRILQKAIPESVAVSYELIRPE